ncbi:MAG TPA: futalosine hydrolase [Desulfurivibrionaceae bacterium]|nr:futalosine hydrolase [Desulfurivibrionaceae bacterium]
MLLVVAATEMELGPVRERLAGEPRFDFLACGIGPVEAAVRLGTVLASSPRKYDLVLHCGVAGAYVGAGAEVLDVCLAAREVLGDLGIEANGGVVPFPSSLAVVVEFPLDPALVRQAALLLPESRIGTFVTVNTATATAARGATLRDRFGALCENMEGAAVARVCQELALPCLEVRAVSNLVEDRNTAAWRLAEACQRNAEATAMLAKALRS